MHSKVEALTQNESERQDDNGLNQKEDKFEPFCLQSLYPHLQLPMLQMPFWSAAQAAAFQDT